VQVRVERRVLRAFGGAVERYDRRVSGRRVARGKRSAVVLDPQLGQRSSSGSGREWTRTRVRVGLVKAT
jgi:hypothetical protein